MADTATLQITVAYSAGARQVTELQMRVPARSTVRQALEASSILAKYPELDMQTLDIGIWGQPASLKHVLQTLDRIEIYRPLSVDPKTARRLRFQKQGARAAGLFKK